MPLSASLLLPCWGASLCSLCVFARLSLLCSVLGGACCCSAAAPAAVALRCWGYVLASVGAVAHDVVCTASAVVALRLSCAVIAADVLSCRACPLVVVSAPVFVDRSVRFRRFSGGGWSGVRCRVLGRVGHFGMLFRKFLPHAWCPECARSHSPSLAGPTSRALTLGIFFRSCGCAPKRCWRSIVGLRASLPSMLRPPRDLSSHMFGRPSPPSLLEELLPP